MKGGIHMYKTRIRKGIAIGCFLVTLMGCNATNAPSNVSDYSKNPDSRVGQDIPVNNNLNHLLDSADIAGTVLEYFDDGCKISQMKTEGNGEIIFEAAPDKVTEDMTVSIQYKESCEVQIANIYRATGEAEIKDGTISDIKKESQIFVNGEFSDTHHFVATKILIVHYR